MILLKDDLICREITKEPMEKFLVVAENPAQVVPLGDQKAAPVEWTGPFVRIATTSLNNLKRKRLRKP